MSKKPQADNLPLPPLPETKFSCISIDPPWHFETRAPVKEPQSDRSPQKHYPTMSLEQIAQLPIRDIATKDAFVFLWITGPLVVNGAHTALMKRWRVTPVSTGFVWIKTTKNFDVNILGDTPLMAQDLHMGMGYTTRQNAEFVILGKIGNPKVARRDIRQVILAPVASHSAKPNEYFRRVEHFCHGPRLDMFAGQERDGWESWGWSHREEQRAAAAHPVRKGVHAKCLSCGAVGPVNKRGVCQVCVDAGVDCPITSPNPNEICDACDCWKGDIR